MKNLLTLQMASLTGLDDKTRTRLDRMADGLNAEVLLLGPQDGCTFTANPDATLARIDDLCNLVGQLVVQNARLLEALVMSEGEEGDATLGSMSNKN